jgi:glycerol-3-phosphate dehydrogenase
MAQDTVDKVVQIGNFREARKCRTSRLTLLGGDGWDKAFFTNISQDFQRMKTSKRSSNQKGLVKIPSDIAQHLSHSYGTRAIHVAKLAEESWGNRLVDGHPYLEAEVVYAAQEEMAVTAVDVVARRLRLAFLDAQASAACSQRVVDILADQCGWSKERKTKEKSELDYFLHTMNVGRTIDQYQDDPDDQTPSS